MTGASGIQCYISIGSNVEPRRNLRLAVGRLRERFGELALSPVYRSSAVGFEGEDFLNLVAGFRTELAPDAVVAELEQLHLAAGRVRGVDRWVPRPLDLDLLLYGDSVSDPQRLPHPDVLHYSFVLGPLAELAPDLRHPVTGVSIAEHWQRFDRSHHALHLEPGVLD